MADYATLKAAIQQVVKTNGNNEITGSLLQQSLLAMINSLGVGYQFIDVATPSTNPGTPDQNVFYIATSSGTYTNFGGIVVGNGEACILCYNGTWTKKTLGVVTAEVFNAFLDTIQKGLGENPVSKTDAESVTNHAILSDGSLSSSSNFRAYYYTNNNYKRVIATLGSNVNTNIAIAFYNTTTAGAASFISGVNSRASANFTVQADVPEGCALIVVSNRNASNNNPEIKIFVEPYIVLVDNPSGGKDLMVGQYNAGTVATYEDIALLVKLVYGGDFYTNSNSYSSLTYFPNPIPGGIPCVLFMPESTTNWHRFRFCKDSAGTDYLSILQDSSGNDQTKEFTSPDPSVYPYIGIQKNNSRELRVYTVGVINDLVAQKQKISNIEQVANRALNLSLQIQDAKLQEIRWDKIFDISGNVSSDDQSFITAKFPVNNGDVVKINAHGYKTGIVMILRNATGGFLAYTNLNVEKTYTVNNYTASYIECAFLKTGYGATIAINDETVFTWTQEMAAYLTTIYAQKFAFEDIVLTIEQNVVNSIKDNSIVFVHLTDTHSGYPDHMSLAQATKHMDMAMRLAQKINADFVVHTGDAIHGFSQSAEPAMESYNALLDKLGESTMPMIWAQGNPSHDFGYQKELTRNQVNTIMGRFGKWLMPNAVFGDTRSFYYFDMARTPCRILVLDPDDGGAQRLSYGFSSQQVTFVQNALSDALTKDLPIVVFAHMPLTGKLMPPYSIDGTSIETAFRNFVNAGGKILSYSFGHTHWDNYYYDKPNGIPYVNLVQEFPVSGSMDVQPEWGYGYRYTRVLGKLSEYAMDVYVIDTNNGCARIFRYGCGNDRISHIDNYTLAVSGTLTLTPEVTNATWSSLNEDIATVNNGVVTGVAAGDAEIIATGANGTMEFFKVTVS